MAAKTMGAFQRGEYGRCQPSVQPKIPSGWGLALLPRGGATDPEDGSKKTGKKIVDEGEEEGNEEEEWADSDDSDDSDGSEDAIVTGWPNKQIPSYYEIGSDVGDDEEQEEPEAGTEVDDGEAIPLSEVLLEQQQKEEAATDNSNNNDMVDEDDFVDALHDGMDVDITSPSTIHTEDDAGSSSATVDRMDLPAANDEELAPVLAMGRDDANDSKPGSSSDYGASISPGGGTDLDKSANNAVETANDEPGVAEQVSSDITDEMKQALRALDWKNQEIGCMKPDMAAVVIDSKLRRPREGMPESMYRPGSKPSGSHLGKVLKRIVLPICLGAVAIYAGSEVDWEALLKARSSPEPTPFDYALVETEPANSSLPSEESTEPLYAEIDDQEKAEEHAEHTSDDSQPSTKPVDIELDRSWLDVVITKIENFIKGIWTKEL